MILNQCQSENFFVRRHNIENSLVVAQYRWYKDLIIDKKCESKELEFCCLTNDLWNECLKALKRMWCEYIVASYNNDSVAIYSKLNKIITAKWTRFWVWYIYWINKPDSYLIARLDGFVTRYPWYSVMPWGILYNLICEANNNWCIQEKDLKAKYVSKKIQKSIWTWLNIEKKNLLKNLKRYSKRISEIRNKDERNEADDNELTMYRQKFNIMNAIAISDVFESWNEIEIKKIIELVKNSKNYYEVINNYVPN